MDNKEKYVARPVETVTLNDIELTDRDFQCIGRHIQKFVIKNLHDVDLEEGLETFGCYDCPYGQARGCHPHDAFDKLSQLTGVYTSIWAGHEKEWNDLEYVAKNASFIPRSNKQEER